MSFSHTPVMLNECLAALAIRPDGTYLDGTAGGAGHSAAIAGQLSGGHLWAMDQDPAAIRAAEKRLQGLPATVLQGNFEQAAEILAEKGVKVLNGALLDLGVSSHQLESEERGFSYHRDAPLDMRMSQDGITAADLVNHESRERLEEILREYGEENYSWQIAGKIVEQRDVAPVTRTKQLADIVTSALPPAVRRKEKHPARRTFQAIRIAVNNEMEVLEQGIKSIFELLAPGGRLAVITFHSLEDRLVKHEFKDWATQCICPPEYPICVCSGRAKGKLVGKNPIMPSDAEVTQNRRSRSAKLRVIEKLEE